jgi:hypothetical protein
LGLVRAGAGLTLASREAAFQVGLTPSLTQVGSAVTLVEGINFAATDTFTQKEQLITLRRPLDSWLTADSGFRLGEDKVVP